MVEGDVEKAGESRQGKSQAEGMEVDIEYEHEDRQNNDAGEVENYFPLHDEFEVVALGRQVIEIS